MVNRTHLLLVALVVLMFGNQADAWRRRRRSCGRRNGGWCGWSGWNKVCGSSRTRSRGCSCPTPYCGGSGCGGSSTERSDTCCPINGRWTGFGAFTGWVPKREDQCDVAQTRTRTRSCTNPAPSCGGSGCSGSNKDVPSRVAAGNNCCAETNSAVGSFWNKGNSRCIQCRAFCERGLTQTVDCQTGKSDGSTENRVCKDLTKPVITLSGANPTIQEGGHDYKEPGFTGTDSFDGDITARVQSGKPDMRSVRAQTITYQLIDRAGNRADTKTRQCNVIDTTPPKITIVGEATQEVHLTHEGGTQYSDPGAVAFDLVDGDVAVSTTGADFDNTHVKVHTVTYTSVDAHKNTKSVTRTVTVVDTNIPEITLTGSALIRVHAHRSKDYVDDGATASDLVDGDVTDKIVMTDPVDLSKPKAEPYIVEFDVTDVAGLKANTVHRKVIVEDIIPPSLVLKGGAALDLEAATDYVEAGWTSADDLDGDITDNVVVTFKDNTGSAVSGIDTMVPDKSVYTVTYTITDAAGNTFAVDRIVTIRDRTAPVFVLDLETTLEFDIEYDEPGWKATDTLDGDLTGRVTVDGPYLLTVRIGQNKETLTNFNQMPVSDVGSRFAIKYTCVDDAGNSATQTRIVTVIDTVIPIITMRGSKNVEHEGGTRYTDAGATATDNYDNALPRRCAGCTSTNPKGDISNEIDTLFFINGTQVSSFDEKAKADTLYTLRYVVKDSNNNVAVPLERQVLIIDTRPPVISVLDDSGRLLQTSEDEPYVVPHLEYQAGGPESTFAEPGFTAKDVLDGIVTDRVAITYVQTNLVTKKLRASCGGEPALADTREEGPTNTVVPFINTVEAAGTTYLITYTISDLHGNVASAQRNVTLVDKVPPTIRRVGEAEQTHEAGFAYRDLGAVATDVVSGLLTGCVETSITSKAGGTVVDPKQPAGTRFEVSYSVENDAGLSSEATKVLDLVDTITPELTVLGPLESIQRVGEAYDGAECVCSDVGDPNLECVASIESLKLQTPGRFTNTFSCTDASDHTASVIGSVRVLPAATNDREGPTDFSITVDLDAFRAEGETSTTTSTAADTSSTMVTIALDFEVSFGRDDAAGGSGDAAGGSGDAADANSTVTEDPETAARNKELLLRSALEKTGNIPFDNDSVIKGVACSQTPSGGMVCTVVIKGTGVDGGAAVADAAASIGGTVTGDSLAVVGFEGAIVLPDDAEAQATFEFPQLDMTTTDVNAINIGLERALGGDVINAGVTGDFKWRTGANGKMVTAVVNFRSIGDAQKASANEQAIRAFVMGVYRQLTETDGVKSSSTTFSGLGPDESGDSGSSLDKLRAQLLLEKANFDNVKDMTIHCTDGVCVFSGRDMPTQSQFDTLSTSEGVERASKMTVKVAPGAERVWYAAWMSSQTDEMLSKIEAAGLLGVSIRRRKCLAAAPTAACAGTSCTPAVESKCPLIFSSMPSATTLSTAKVLVNDSSLTVEPYAREAACFEPDLQGGPSNDEGRALLHIAGLSALDVQCSPGTVCCFSTAFPYNLQPLLAIPQVTRVSSTVFGAPAATPQTVIQFMASSAGSDITKSSGDIQAAVESMLAESDRQRRSNDAVHVDCDSVGKQHCTASFERNGDEGEEGGVSADAMRGVQSAVQKIGLVAYSSIASTGLKGSLAFTPAKLDVDAAVVRYLLVENNIDAKDVACAAGGCKYTVSSLRDVPDEVTKVRAVDHMDQEIAASVAPVSGFQARGAFVATSEFDPITTPEAGRWLSAAGILASSVSCSAATCVFEVDYFTGSHTSLLMATGDVEKVIFPISTSGKPGPNTFAGSFKSANGATLATEEATAVLLAVGIVADGGSVECKHGTCEFMTSQDVGLSGVKAMFESLKETESDATSVSGPDLVDEMFLLEKAIVDSIVDSAGARRDQVVFNGIINETSGEVSFSIIPACGAEGNAEGKADERQLAKERVLAEADGCVEANDQFVNAVDFEGDRDELETLITDNGIDVVEIRDEGDNTFIVVTNTKLSDAQKATLAGLGAKVTGTSRKPVLSIKEIQTVLSAKALEGELDIPLQSSAIVATSTNRTDSETPFPIIPVAAGAGGFLLLVVIIVLCVVCDCNCCGGSGGKSIDWTSSKFASPGAIGFENPMYDQNQIPSNGFYDDVPGAGSIVPGGFYDEVPGTNEGGTNFEGYYADVPAPGSNAPGGTSEETYDDDAYYQADMYADEDEDNGYMVSAPAATLQRGSGKRESKKRSKEASTFANAFEEFDGFGDDAPAVGGGDDGYLEVQADHDGQGEVCASHLVTGRTCVRTTSAGSKYCAKHTCTTAGCSLLKSSRHKTCNEHSGEAAYTVVQSASDPTYATTDGIGQGGECASHLVTGRTCAGMKEAGSQFCSKHSCKEEECQKLKSSRAQYCSDHRAAYA